MATSGVCASVKKTSKMARSYQWTFALLSFLLLVSNVHAYIPASPVNGSTTQENSTAMATLNLAWFKGVYSESVSYQLVGADSDGYNQGALLKFSENNLSNDTTTTPWIALVSCDANATDASQEIDIFTAAKTRGAVAALLYSVYSERCKINSEYSEPENFDQVMDIFSSPDLSASQIIEVEYNALNQSKYRDFNATLLNATASLVNNSLTYQNFSRPNYLFATLVAANATGGPDGAGDDNNNGDGGDMSLGSTGDGSGGLETKNSLAMIILYVITGCVSALFCVVIVSGAVRAIRHPERYGPRAGYGGSGGGNFGPAQSRARGLTRAILDTFPVVKFGRSQDADASPPPPRAVKDLESASSVDTKPAVGDTRSEELELRELPAVAAMLRGEREQEPMPGDAARTDQTAPGEVNVRDEAAVARMSQTYHEAGSSSSASAEAAPRLRRPLARASVAEASTSSAIETDLVPDAIGRETCPICIVDFEEGDDLRVLPCEGHHRFHQQCVDPWLLELSSSCPLCRQDFHALETMMSSDGHGSPDGEYLEPPHPHYAGTRPLSTAGARLSRYLKLARRTRRRNREGVPRGYDPTNPPMPVAPETSLEAV
ncbi:hypothetical protein BC835DRAFT_1366082 [Cytidiella melzeri]|nr:hypothetical protein BC835DRAFT_1366082 [Cytidiella melzeri]